MVHGTVIDISDLKQRLPKRKHLLDPELYSTVSETIAKGQPLLFMPNDVYDGRNMQDKKYDKATYKIVLFGVFEDGRKATVVLDGVFPYFEIRVPDSETDPVAFAERIFDQLEMEGPNDYAAWKKITNGIMSDNKESADGKEQSDVGEPADDREQANYKRRPDEERKRAQYFKIEPIRYEINQGKPFKYYQEHLSSYVRIYFNKLGTKFSQRIAAIKWARAKGYDTAHDDIGSYYRVVSRDYLLSFCSWIQIKNYRMLPGGTSPHIKGAVFHVNVANATNYVCPDQSSEPEHIEKDNLLTMCWDIETYNSDRDGRLPLPEHPTHRIFMIGVTFQWYSSSQQLLRVCLVDVPSAPHPDFLTVVCHDEKGLLGAFSLCFRHMRPDIVMGFNDSTYDWPWIIERVKMHDLLGTFYKNLSMLKHSAPQTNKQVLFNYRALSVKIEADVYVNGNNFQVPGYISVDVMIAFRQIFPTSEKWSLNYFLKENRLGVKKDMPYEDMFDIYEMICRTPPDDESFDGLRHKMKDVAEYCVIDAQRCHELLKIRAVIKEKRELSNLSFTSVYDAFYRANGMKVRNLVIARGAARGLKFSNISNDVTDSRQYPGAYVFPPIKGLVTSRLSIDECVEKAKQGYSNYADWLDVDDTQKCKDFVLRRGASYDNLDADGKRELDELPSCMKTFLSTPTGRPITGLDFSSLYPSLIMTYNLSPEYIVSDKRRAMELSERHNLHKIKFNMGNDTVRGWAVRHDNVFDPDAPNFKFGLFPTILRELFAARKKIKEIKKGLKYWDRIIEHMRLLPPEELDARKKEYDNAMFEYAKINSKQQALKVYMNTFYGEVGNKRSPLFMLLVAGGITSAGQYNIKSAHKFVVDHGCGVYYGDTDSIYLKMPESVFEPYDRRYFAGLMTKIDYWESMVRETFKLIVVLNDGVNNWFKCDNGTDFLKMAFEESLFPVLFLAKKKYVGVPHISEPNFTIDDKHPLFVRGLALKTRGVAELLKDVCNDILRQSMMVSNILTVREIVLQKITEIYQYNWSTDDFDKFIMTAVYKPHKNNVKMHVFNDRMLERGIALKPGERNEYVVVKKYPFRFDDRGKKIALKVGDLMELADVARAENMSIDLDYYMTKTINGQLARFITYHPDFYVAVANYNDDVEVSKAEDKILTNARKFINAYCQQYNTTFVNKGPIYKNIFKVSSKAVYDGLYKSFDEKMKPTIKLLTFSLDESDDIASWFRDRVEKSVVARSYNKKYGELYVNYMLDGLEGDARWRRITVLQKSFYSSKNSIRRSARLLYQERQNELERRLRIGASKIKKMFSLSSGIIKKISDHVAGLIDIDDLMNEPVERDDKVEYTIDTIGHGIVDPGEMSFDEIKRRAGIDDTTIDRQIGDIACQELESKRDGFVELLTEMRHIQRSLAGNYEYMYQIDSIITYLKSLRDRRVGTVVRPQERALQADIKKMIDDAVASR